MNSRIPRHAALLVCVAWTTSAAVSVTTRVHECPDGLTGAWHSVLPIGHLFEIELTVVERGEGDLVATIGTRAGTEEVRAWRDGERIRFQSVRFPLSFSGVVSSDGSSLDGFVQPSSSIVRVTLKRKSGADDRRWTTRWSPLIAQDTDAAFDLYIEEDGQGGIGGYFFFRDQRFPGLSGYGLRCENGSITLGEQVLGLEFEGVLNETSDELSLTVSGPGGSAPMTFERMSSDQIPPVPDAPGAPPRPTDVGGSSDAAPEALDDGWPTGTPSSEGLDAAIIGDLIDSVIAGDFEYTHGILVARRGKLVVEEYFYDFDRDTRHDMRSASKSLTSTFVGLAIQEGLIAGPQSRALTYFPRYRWYANWDDRKADISVKDLLTMSSGLDARDWESESVAAEGAYQSQKTQPDWVKFALDAPMIWDPGTHVYYGGANPLILGGILANVVGEPVEWFTERMLFGPLGIQDYSFFVDPTGVPYMGGGMYLRPRDMAKLGQLYLDGGTWHGSRILSAEWIDESWGKYGRLEPIDRNGHWYGYLWWHHQYNVGDRSIETVEARGNGGQYIFVVPSLEMVVVITSGNFRNGRVRLPEEILHRWILPAAIPTESGGGA